MHVVDSPTVDSPAVDRTNLHLIWKAILIGIALLVATACYFVPVLLVALGVLLVFLLFARLFIGVVAATFQISMLGTSAFTTTHTAHLSATRFRICVGARFEATRSCRKRRA